MPGEEKSLLTKTAPRAGDHIGNDLLVRVAEIGPHHRVWQHVSAITNGQGRVLLRTNSYTELETGMHVRQPDGSWAEASDEIELTPTGAAATRTQHRVNFPADISAGVIELLTPDDRTSGGGPGAAPRLEATVAAASPDGGPNDQHDDDCQLAGE